MKSLTALLIAVASAAAAEKTLTLNSAEGLSRHQVELTPEQYKGKHALKVTAPAGQLAGDHLALLTGVEFSNGTIEVDLAGEPGPGAAGGARGFVGVAFRVQPDGKTYDCFYLRPTNGRADDQERRNHSAQYISHPVYTWSKLRQETPSKYESWVDIGPAEWIHVRIDVEGEKAKLFVNGASQPALIVNDVKTGASGKGSVGLWIEGSTIARFANLKVTTR